LVSVFVSVLVSDDVDELLLELLDEPLPDEEDVGGGVELADELAAPLADEDAAPLADELAAEDADELAAEEAAELAAFDAAVEAACVTVFCTVC